LFYTSNDRHERFELRRGGSVGASQATQSFGSPDVDKLLKPSPLCFQPFTVSHPRWVVVRQVPDAPILDAQLHLRAQQRARVDNF
jgi:hypothetical protein